MCILTFKIQKNIISLNFKGSVFKRRELFLAKETVFKENSIKKKKSMKY